MSAQPSVTISVLNWNSWEETLGCLAAVREIDYPGLRLIVVDNGSVDESVEKLMEWASGDGAHESITVEQDRCTAKIFPDVTLLLSPENLGFCGGNNLSIEWALGQDDPPNYIFLHNNDARPEPTLIRELVAAAEEADAAITGAVVTNPETGEVQFAGAWLPRELFFGGRVKPEELTAPVVPVGRVEGSGIMLRRDLLEARRQDLGYALDENLFIYTDEAEICLWARKRGMKTVIAREARMSHAVSLAFGGKRSPIPFYYFTRNKMYVVRKHFGFAFVVLFHCWYVPATLLRVVQRFVTGRFAIARATWRGMWAGLFGITGKWRGQR